jgi:hypothetical protein
MNFSSCDVPAKTRHHTVFIHYDSKAMDLINMNKCFAIDKELNEQVDIYRAGKAIDIRPKIRFTYNKPLGVTIMNYRRVALCDNDYRRLPPCKCQGELDYIDKHHKHVVTGQVGICHDRQTEMMLGKGAAFRPNQTIDWQITESYLTDVVKNYAKRIKRTYPEIRPLCAEVEYGWIENVHKQIRIAKLHAFPKVTELKTDLHSLSKNYVITATDKSKQNYSFTCKHFYVKKLKEILDDEQVYEKIHENYEIVMKKIETASTIMGIEISSSMKNLLPFAQLNPKFHKTPVDFRAIISSKKACTKPASKILGNCLSLIQYNLKRYCETIFNNTKVNMYWIIDRNVAILNCLEGISSTYGAKNLCTFDFGQMYTNLKHDDIKNAIYHVVSIAMSKIKYIYADMYSASWQCKRSSMLTISKENLLKISEFVLDNAYFRFGSNIYRQIVGIPMGTDAGPFIANLTLFSYEFKYVNMLMNTGKIDVARTLSNTFRYIDDITSVNDGGVFENVYKEIYPESLTLKKMNDNDQEANVLDIKVKIRNGKFICSVYDKRDDFPFICNRFPAVDTNISKNSIYNIFTNEMNRFFTICSDTATVFNEIKKLKDLLLARRYLESQLSARFSRFIRKNKQFNRKFDLDFLANNVFP